MESAVGSSVAAVGGALDSWLNLTLVRSETMDENEFFRWEEK